MRGMTRIVVLGTMLVTTPVGYAQAETMSSSKRVAADPNERICEDIIQTGSRLAKKRFCGTRAEWEARKKADKEVVEDAQRHAADPCNMILTHTGPASC
jgi:hypothetical protein